VKAIIPPGGLVAVSQGSFTINRDGGWPATLVLVETAGGPTFTLTPEQWAYLVSQIRAAPNAAVLGA
jgi:hypothetical protein